MSKIIRISETAYNDLAELEKTTGTSKQQIIEKALDRVKRDLFFKKLDQDYKTLKQDPRAWQEELVEREEWETINDNLEDL